MLNTESFRELCRKASIETDPAKLAFLKDALRLILQAEGIQLYRVQRTPIEKLN
jgi:hypothetical protein